ncbi:hypothetical protein GALL_478610 [mine drainage metagenome]|uniref:Uncharacterized protein n=1 Tax=mine drainage metagenome TaxID=410659 RepID=A0A1J5PIC0_9ZZZZ
MQHRQVCARRGGRVGNRSRIPLDEREDLRVGDEAALDHLGESGDVVVPRQRPEGREVAQDPDRRMEGTDQVLALGRVDARLPADRGVNHGEQRRGQVDHADPAQPGGRHEPCQVGRRATAERHDRVGARELGLPEHLPAGGSHLGSLRSLGVRDLRKDDDVSRREEIVADLRRRVRESGGADDQHLGGRVAEQPRQLRSQVGADHDVVWHVTLDADDARA